MLNYKKVIKISLISFFSLLSLLIISIILLLIFFPSELARKEIEKQASNFLQTEIKIEKLSFSIFSGLELNNLTVMQPNKRWKDEYIVQINKAYLKYNLLPLIFKKELSVKACVVEAGVINLERNRYGANWDHFMDIFNNVDKDSNKKNKDPKTKKAKEKITKDSLPIDLNLKKIGVENISLNYIDRTFFDIPLLVNLKDVTFLAKNIKLKDNKPFNLSSKISISIDGDEYINLSSFVRSNGKLRIFDDFTSEVYLNGPIKIDLGKTRFSSKLLKELIVKCIKDLIGNIIGPEFKDFLKDKNLVLKESEVHFRSILDNSDGIINKEIERANKIVNKKKDFIKYKAEILNDFEDQLSKPLDEINSKIESIDSRISPIIDTASKIPFIENFTNLSRYRDKINGLQDKSKKYRDAIRSKYTKNLENDLMGTINNAIPARIPGYNDYKKEFNNRVELLKNNLVNNVGNFSISSFVESYIPDLTFIDKGFDISNLSTVYYLNKKEAKGENFKFKSKYFNINGDFKNVKNKIDFVGIFDFNNEFLNINFLPSKGLKTKVQILGELNNLKIKILEFPDLKIDSDKLKEVSISILRNFLAYRYSDNTIISDVLKKFKIMDINENELKKIFLEKENINLKDFLNEKNKLLNTIDGDINDIIDDLRDRVPGL